MTTAIIPPTPYVNEDGDLWFRVADVPLSKARTEAAAHARDTLGDWGRARFTGKQTVPLHTHEDWMDRGADECDCGESESWHFVVYER